MSANPTRIETLTESGHMVLPHERGERADRLSAHGVTVVVPVYNEERAVEGVLERLSKVDLGAPVELLAINDGSRDRTGEKLAELVLRLPNLRVVTHRSNMGYGAALKTGFVHAKHQIVVITDADGTYPEDRIRDLLDCIDDGAEMAVGARLGENVSIPLLRRPPKWVLRKLASFLAGTEIPDLNSGLRAFRRELVLAYRPILPQGFSFTTTITLAALTNAHRVDYIEVDYAPGLLRRPLAARVALLRSVPRGAAQPGRQDGAALRGLDPDPVRRSARGPDGEALAALTSRPRA
jgi:glycosyltransferase involved in cell wall biosynthesis